MRWSARRLAATRAVLGDGLYQLYFQSAGVADAELARDPRRTLSAMLHSLSGDAPQPENSASLFVMPPSRALLDILPDPQTLPSWSPDADIDYYASRFARTGFTAALNCLIVPAVQRRT